MNPASKMIAFWAALCACAPLAHAASFTRIVVDPTNSTVNGTGSLRLEKVMVDVNKDGVQDLVVGQGTGHGGTGGMFWYQAPGTDLTRTPWAKHTIAASGNFYEGAAALDVDKDGWPDIVASCNGQLVWFKNPANTNATSWAKHIINSSAGAHEVRIADLDGDGKMDVIASGSQTLHDAAFVAFQNSPDSWTIKAVAPVDEGVALPDIGSGRGAINIVGADTNGDIVWYENPRESGAAGSTARTSTWLAHKIGTGNQGVAVMAGFLTSTSRMDVVIASNELEAGVYTGGLVRFTSGSNVRNVWTKYTIDSSYRDVHAINIYDVDHNGKNDIVVGEQEQAGGAPGIPADHPGIPSRLTIFYGNGSGSFTAQILDTNGAQNQVVGDMTGTQNTGICYANHGNYGANNPVICYVQVPGNTAPPPPPSPVFHQTLVPSGGATVSPAASLQPTSITVEAWITASGSQTNYPAFVSYGSDAGPNYESYILQAHNINGNSPADFYFLTGAGTHHQVYGTTKLQVGQRYCLIATYNAATGVADLYVNGSLEGSLAASGSLYYSSNGLGLSRKYSTTANDFIGRNEGVKIFNTVLTGAQIKTECQAGPN